MDKDMKQWSVKYRTSQSTGNITVSAIGKKQAMQIVENRMSHATVVDAKEV